MSDWKLEVKVHGTTWQKNADYEVIWLDWSTFHVIPLPKNNATRLLVGDGNTAFTILRGKSRDKYLTEHGFSPEATWSPETEQQEQEVANE